MQAFPRRMVRILAYAIVLNMTQNVRAQSWKFSVDPGVESKRPAVVVSSDAKTTENLKLTIFDISKETSGILKEVAVKPGKDSRFETPIVKSPTPVEFCFTHEASREEEPVFRWRTMALPHGQQLLLYRGSREYPPPSDFELFWKQARLDLSEVRMDPVIERVPDKDTTTGLLHKVTLNSLGGVRIVCWYFVPKEAFDEKGRVRSQFPAVIIMPGYGAEEPPIDRTTSGIITLSVNPRNHGPSREYWKCPTEHLLWNIDDPERFYYRFAYMDCVRAAEFLFSRAEVDPRRVAAEGGSQGGLFALALAALEPRIACVTSNVTAFSAYGDGMRLALKGHQTQYAKLLRENPTSASLIRRSLALTDGANMATLIRCPVQINMGGVDPVCNYVAGIVVYNRLARGVPREYHVVPDCGHAVPPAMREWNQAWYRRWLKLP